MFKVISTDTSTSRMRSEEIEAMEIKGIGCLIRSRNITGKASSELMCFVPGVKIREEKLNERMIVREIVPL